MEQIYTIPVNEKFEECAAAEEVSCPFCALYRSLEENELDLILGASMMEPDVRIKTNELGFCKTHYDMMFERKNRLGLALMLESHLHEKLHAVEGGGLADKLHPGEGTIKELSRLNDSCYVCGRIEHNFGLMVETAVMLWERDESFRPKIAGQKCFCLPHYELLLETAKSRLQKKQFPEFYGIVSGIEVSYMTSLSEDVSWFCKKFDYRYSEEPWGNAKDAVQRALKFLSGDIHRPPEKKTGGKQ
ncbi:MAG: DUF6062 family protein [Firmicutes bacterium]|nr:DUF6062 family protein [Bacillota bacterium]